MKRFIQTLRDKAERHLYASILPPREAVMLLDGKRYETGSDYSKKRLEETIEDNLAGSYECYIKSHTPAPDYDQEVEVNCKNDAIDYFSLHTGMDKGWVERFVEKA